MYRVEVIKSDLLNHRINQRDVIKYLTYIIGKEEDQDNGIEITSFDSNNYFERYWDTIDKQLEAIKTFRKLNLKNEEIYKLLENLTVSESNDWIRAIAIKEITILFPKETKKRLKWIDKNDNWFKTIKNNSKNNSKYHSNFIYFFRRGPSAIAYDILTSAHNNSLKKIQEKLMKFISPKIQRYVLEGVNPVDASILVNFELQCGFKLINAEKEEYRKFDLSVYYDCNYILNKEGRVTGVFIIIEESELLIPKEIYLLEYLETLVLRRSNIRYIPKSIHKLKKLKLLDLSSNNIKNIPQSVHLPENLEKLYISSNRLISIPESILNLENLKVLSLGFNQIEILPNSFKNMKNLMKLDLNENIIKQIPKSIKDLKSINLIDPNVNPIQELPSYFNSPEWSSKIKISSANK